MNWIMYPKKNNLMNNHGGFGQWAFIEIKDPWNIKNEIEEMISNIYLKNDQIIKP